MRRLRVALLGLALVAPVLAAEVAHRQASRWGPRTMDRGSRAVVVLGYRSGRHGRPHPLQRWRAAIGVRSLGGDDSVLVFTGAGRPGGPSEAEVMAGWAMERFGISADRVLLEEEARSTEQNVAFTLPLVGAHRIAYASDPLHAARARAHLRRLRPDLVPRLAAAADYRPLERPLLKTATAAYEAYQALRRWRYGNRRGCG